MYSIWGEREKFSFKRLHCVYWSADCGWPAGLEILVCIPVYWNCGTVTGTVLNQLMLTGPGQLGWQ